MSQAAYIVLSVIIHWLKEKNEEIKVLPFASVRKTSLLTGKLRYCPHTANGSDLCMP